MPEKTEIEEFIAGLQIIQKYDPKARIFSGHEIIIVSDEETWGKMTEEDQKALEENNWHYSTEYNSIAYFT